MIADLVEQKNVLPIRADTTEKSSPATAALKDTYDEPGVPVSILLLPDADPIRMHGPWFAKRLQELLTNITIPEQDSNR